MTENDKQTLTTDVYAEIDKWIAKYPADKKHSAVIPALHIVQDAYGGSLTTALMDAVAEHLDMQPMSVYEVATFYSMYELKPVGENKICICTNVSCQLRGSDEIVAHIKDRLGIGLGETTPDNKFTLKEVECLGACGGAPMFLLNKKYYENLTTQKVDEIIDALNKD